MSKSLIAVLVAVLAAMLSAGCATKAQNAALAGGIVGYAYGVATARPPQAVYIVPVYRDTPCGRVSIDSQYECMLRTRTWSNGVVERYYVWVRR